MSTANAVGWFEIYVSDMQRALNFYEAVFQRGAFTDLSFDGEELFEFPSVEGGAYASGALVKSEGYLPGKGGTMVYFNSPDCGVEEARVVDNGGIVLSRKHPVGEHGFVCQVQDTEGNVFGIHSRK